MNYFESTTNFPTVATVIGFTPNTESGPLVATLAYPSGVVANMSTQQMSATTLVHPTAMDQSEPIVSSAKNITKNDPVKLSCDICKIEVTAQSILDEHLAGAKHARKLKSVELMKDMQSLISNSKSGLLAENNTYTCRPCNVIVNSIQQLQFHCQGLKHKSKAGESGALLPTPTTTTTTITASGNGMITTGDENSSRFYCSTCNVRVNSDTQLEQHKLSKKHTGKLHGGGDQNNRVAPYFKNQRKLFVKEGWNSNDGNINQAYNSGAGTDSSGVLNLKCNVCGVCANSITQLEQHFYSKKHKERLIEKGETVNTPLTAGTLLQPPPFLKKQLNPQNDSLYNYNSYGSYGGNANTGLSSGGYSNYNIYSKWPTTPSYQRSQTGGGGGGYGGGGYNRY